MSNSALQRVNLYPATTSATGVNVGSYCYYLGSQLNFCLQSIFSGSNVAGTFTVYGSCDPNGSTPTNWVALATGTSVTSSAGTLYVNGIAVGSTAPSVASWTWVSFAWSYSSGTGNMTVNLTAKSTEVYS